MRVAIDGLSGTGKSTVAAELAKELNLVYFNTGNIYRVYTYVMLQNDLTPKDAKKVIELVACKNLELDGNTIYLDGEDITLALRSPEVNENVSKLSPLSCIRDCVHKLQYEYIDRGDLVMEGRDITSNIMVDTADIKFFFTGQLDTRTKRFHKILFQGPLLLEYYQVVTNKDTDDMNREHGKLIQVDDAIVVDTSDKNIEEVLNYLKFEITNHKVKVKTYSL